MALVNLSDEALFSDPRIRGDSRCLISCIRVNYIYTWKGDGEQFVEYLVWDNVERDFYSIEDKELVDKLDAYIKDSGLS